MIRPYIDNEIHNRVLKYAEGMGGFKLHTRAAGISEFYSQLINGVLDENGKPRAGIILTESQMKMIDEVSEELNQTPSTTTQMLVNVALLIFNTNIPLKIALMRAAPLMMDELVQVKPGMAKEILISFNQIKNETAKPNPQAALRYSE